MGKNKKTREQKIISDLRRKLALRQAQDKPLRQTSVITPSTPLRVSANKQGETANPPVLSEKKTTLSIPQTVTEGAFKIHTQIDKKPVAIYVFGDYSFLTSDLKKVGVLTGLAILAQTVLYLALR